GAGAVHVGACVLPRRRGRALHPPRLQLRAAGEVLRGRPAHRARDPRRAAVRLAPKSPLSRGHGAAARPHRRQLPIAQRSIKSLLYSRESSIRCDESATIFVDIGGRVDIGSCPLPCIASLTSLSLPDRMNEL